MTQTTIITCDHCIAVIEKNGYWAVAYNSKLSPDLSQWMHFCDSNHMLEVLNIIQRKSEKND